MQFLESIPAVLLIIGGIILTAIGIVWIILPFLLISRLDKIHRELQLIEINTKMTTPSAVPPAYRAPAPVMSKDARDAAWRAAQSAE